MVKKWLELHIYDMKDKSKIILRTFELLLISGTHTPSGIQISQKNHESYMLKFSMWVYSVNKQCIE